MSLENRKKTGIGKKIDSHEFDFNPAAWDKMESMLNAQDSPEDSGYKPVFFTFKNLAAMVFLIVLAFILFPVHPSYIINSEREKIIVVSEAEAKTNETGKGNLALDEEAQTPEKTLFSNNKTTAKKAGSFKLPALAFLPVYSQNRTLETRSSLPLLPTPLLLPSDSNFLPKLKANMAARNEQFSPEKVYLQTDKPFYKPGETLWFNSYIRDANSLKSSEKSDFLNVELLKPNGGILQKIKIKAHFGTAAGDFFIPHTANGGIYKIKAYTNWQRNENTFFEREISVQKNVLPNLRMQLDFMKKSYGPGDAVTANLELKNLADEPLKSHTFGAKITLDGADFKTLEGKTNEFGAAKITFSLPEKLNSSDGMLNVMILYSGQTESIARPIPILLKNIDIQFFPEGGDLLAGYNTKIAFKAIDEHGKPADIQGMILNENSEIITNFQSFHDGMGGFNLSAKSGERYTAKITKPKGVEQSFELPKAKSRGFALKVTSAKKDNYLIAKIHSTERKNKTVVVRAGDEIYFSKTVSSFENSVRIPTDNLPVGIAQITLFDAGNIPRAERLVFVNADKNLNVQLKTDKKKYLPREKVALSIEVKDERGIGIPGRFSLAVTDDKLLSYADDKQGHILSALLLESELKGTVSEPNFYFEKDEKEPAKSRASALDYLMLTHGWRRFNWESVLMPPKFAEAKFRPEKSEVAGTVYDENGKPSPGVSVRLEELGLETRTDNNGCFVFEKVDFLPDQYQLKVMTGGKTNIRYMSGLASNLTLYKGGDPLPITAPGAGHVWGKIIDEETGESLIGASVMLRRNGRLVQGTVTDFDGFYAFQNIEHGAYELEASYTGYNTRQVSKVPVVSNKKSDLNLTMSSAGMLLESVVVTGMGSKRKARRKKKREKTVLEKNNTLNEVVVTDYAVPIIQQDETTSGGTIRSESIEELPVRNVSALKSVAIGVQTEKKPDNISGKKADETLFFNDGVSINREQVAREGILEIDDSPVGLTGEPKRNAALDDCFNCPIDGESKLTIAADSPIPSNGYRPNYRINLPYDLAFAECADIPNKYQKRNCAQTKLNEFIYSNLNYPLAASDEKRSETVWINVKIDKNGQVENVYLPKKVDEKLDAEALRIANILPEFKVSKSIVPRMLRIPIHFKSESYAAVLTNRGIYTPRQFYVPKYTSKEQPTIRDDFRETIYWNPSVETDRNGKATVEFFASDAVTAFRATLEGIGITGDIGRGTETFFTQLPFGMSVKMPPNLVEGDLIKVPVSLANHTDKTVEGHLNVSYPAGLIATEKLPSTIKMPPGNQTTIYLPFLVENATRKKSFLKVEFKANGLQDAFIQEINTSPRGFPVSEVFSGNELEKTFEINVVNPVKGSVSAVFSAHPSPVSDLISGLDRMLRQPNGCFEQTSSSNYPNLLALNYLRETEEVRPDIEKRGKGFLKKGYNRLKTFEVKGGGFDWYGKAPAHEGLTAYGLMQFQDMKGVFEVEQKLIDRTAKWLMNRRDGKGGWQKKQRALHSWLMSDEIADAYIVWALSEAGFGKKIEKEVEKSLNDALFSDDSYLLGLMSNTLLNYNDKRADDLLERLLENQASDGSFSGKTTSIVGSRGKNLTIETTGLAALALIKKGDRSVSLEKAVKYLASAKSQYGFGSTQATVLAMKALVKYSVFSKKLTDNGMIALYLNGNKIAEEKYKKGQSNPLIFNGLENRLQSGKQELTVKFSKTKTALPFEFSLDYSTLLPPGAAECRVQLTANLRKASVKQGENVRLDVSLKNRTAEGLPNTIAIVGIPAGMSTRPKQLKKLSEEGVFDFYEILPTGFIAFHFRGMAPEEVKHIPLELKADLPGAFESPASVAYLYYENDLQFWSQPERVVIE